MSEDKLYRRSITSTRAETVWFLVSEKHRDAVMELAHSGMMAGHLRCGKNAHHILSEFFWPGLHADVKRFVASCDICQRTTPRDRTRGAPLGRMPVIDTPFKRVAVDVIGLLAPSSDRGNRFILTMVDNAARFLEAVALPSIDAEIVAEALVNIFS